MHILLANCKKTVSEREGEEENLLLTAVGKATVFSLQCGPGSVWRNPDYLVQNYFALQKTLESFIKI